METFIRNFFENFIENRFNEEYEITPAQWNTRILFFNMGVAASLGVTLGIITCGVIAIVLLFFNTSLPLVWYIAIGIAVFGYTVYERAFIERIQEVENGHFGIITILGEMKGSIDKPHKPYILTDGKFREIIKIPFFPEVVEILTDGKKLKAFEYDYSQVKSKDGIPFGGKAGLIPFIHNPYEYATMMLSIGKEELRERIEEICLRALNGSFNEFHSDTLIAGENSAEDLEENYFNTLQKNRNDCEQKGDDTLGLKNFFTEENIKGPGIFQILGTGLGARFYIKTYNAPEKLQEQYTKRSGEQINQDRALIEAETISKTTVIKSFGTAKETLNLGRAQTAREAWDIKQKGIVEAEVKVIAVEAEKKVAEEREKIIENLSNKISSLPAYEKMSPEAIKDMVEATMDTWDTENKNHNIHDVRGLESLINAIERVFGIPKSK